MFFWIKIPQRFVLAAANLARQLAAAPALPRVQRGGIHRMFWNQERVFKEVCVSEGFDLSSWFL